MKLMKEKLNGFLNRVISFFYRIDHPRLSVPEFNPLSPCIIEPYVLNDEKEEENKAYIPVSLLIRALNDNRILNIAVAGNYGVGKSSIVNTAEQVVGKKHKFIKISLASLLTQEGKDDNSIKEKNESGDDDSTNDNKVKGGANNNSNYDKHLKGETVTAKQIEYSILQQILYHDRAQATPKSRIRRIHKTRWYKPYLIAFMGLLLFVSLVIILNPTWFKISDYFSVDNAPNWVNQLYKWGPIVFLAIFFIEVCKYCGQHYSFSFARVGYKNVEMKIVDEMSIFNAYLDEIVYFFESTGYDVVVFEDLDRFVNKDIIFYKLRELNTILNNCQSLTQRVNFVYAVLDHLFDSSERVKFFDYIITVIPVINSLNSYNMLKKSIQSEELFDKLGRNELLILCEYLQDMRLLLNIVNEFNQFCPLIDRTVMSDKILFGLVVYKNYVPSDFSRMYNRSGVVASVLDKTDSCRETIIKEMTREIERLQSEIKTKEEEKEKRQNDLRLQYLEKGKALSSYPSSNLKIRIDEKIYTFETVAGDPQLFKNVRGANAVYIINNSNLTQIPSFNTVELNNGGVGHFDKTMESITKDCIVKVDGIKSKIKELSYSLSKLPKTVDGIFMIKPDVLEEGLKELKNKEKQDLVKFLVLNGYLDQDYQYYISYFYPNALKRGDRNFVMKAARRDMLQYEVRLEAIDEVLKRFTPEKMANNPSLLNVYLVRDIFQDKNYQRYRESVCSLISSYHHLDFLLVAYRTDIKIPEVFFNQVLGKYDFWDQIDEYRKTDQENLREIYVKFCDLREEKKNPSFITWLPDNFVFFDKHCDAVSPNRVVEIFEAYSPVFNKLTLENTPEMIFNNILRNQRYELNRYNINTIVKKLGFYDDYKNAAYTNLMADGNETILQTVSANWPLFLKSIFPDTSVKEGEAAQVAILNDAIDSQSLYESKLYITKQRYHITSAEQLHDDILDFVFENSLIVANWHNIYYYSITKGKGLPIKFLYKNAIRNNVGESLSAEEDESALRKQIVFTDDLKLSKYKELVPLFTTPFAAVENVIQPARMKYLLENNLIAFTAENYKTIRNVYDMSDIFLVNNINEFKNAPELYPVGSSEIIAALRSMKTKKAKCELIRAIRNISFIPNAELASIVSPLVINGDIKLDEINIQLLCMVIAKAPEEKRVSLGRRSIVSKSLEKEDVLAILQSIGGEYQRLTTSTIKSTLSYSRDAVQVLNHLVKNGFLKGYEKTGDKLIVNKL